MPDATDPAASALDGIRKRANGPMRKFGDVDASQRDIARLIAAVEAALSRHVQAVIEDMPDPFHYCETCAGHPAWPCPEVAAITAALAGKEAASA